MNTLPHRILSLFPAAAARHRACRRCARWLVAVAVGGVMATASAQVTLESVDNAVLAGSGPTGNGPSAAAQVVTLRHNTDNPTGNTMVARTPAVTVTYALSNQQFANLTATDGYPANTGGNAVFFGGNSKGAGLPAAPLEDAIYHAVNGVGGATANLFTSANAAAGQGISLTANGTVRVMLSTNAIAVRAPATPLTARVRMADLELTFSTPVDNPVLHVVGLGSVVNGSVPQPYTAEFDVLTPGVTLTRLSGNTPFAVTGNQINNGAAVPAASCSTNGACGSVRFNGTGITTLSLRMFLRGAGDSGAVWANLESGVFNADGIGIGVSLTEPPVTVTVRKVTEGGTGTFDFSGNNGYTATSVTTVTAGTEVAGTTRTLSAANTATTITEATVAGYRLSGITCTGLGAGGIATVGTLPAAGVAGGGAVTLDAAATALGSNIVCTFSNERLPVIRVQKVLPDGRAGASDQFTLRIANGATVLQSATTNGSSTAPTQSATLSPATVGTSYTLSEIASGTTSLANYSTTYSCTNARSGGQTPSGNGSTFNVTPAAGDDLTCTFSNARRPRLTLIKTVTNDDGGTQPATAWTLSASGPTPISGTTGSAAVTNAAVNPGTYTLSESALPAGYSAAPYSCAINGGAPVSGNSVTLATGDSAVCRIHNDDVGTPGQPMTCGITSHTGATLTAPLFGPEGVNTHILLENVAFDAASGSVTRFVDSNGRTYATPPGPGRWLLTNSTTTTRVTVTFVPSIPAHRIGIGIYDMGTWDATLPNNGEDASYAPRLTLDLLGVNNEATTSQFVAHLTRLNATQASYSPGTGVVTLDAGAFVPGNEGTWRQSVFLRGNANALVSALTLTATNIKQGDHIAFGLVAIPSCVTISKVTEGDVGGFDFTTTNVNNWNNTASASPVTLTTTATGTPVNSARHYYAHPVASNGLGTQPVVLSETIPPTWVLSSARCTDANSSRNGNTGSFGSLVGGTLTIPADRMRFESNITCAFTNTRAAILRLQKALPDGRAATNDQFTLSMTGTGAPAAVTTTGAGSTATGLLTHDTATPGSAYTLSEAAAGGADLSYYTTTYRCTNARAGGQTPAGDGTTFAVTPAVGDDLTCTLTNLRRTTDLSIRKTVADEPLVSGAQAVFTLVITNHGPGAADGATVRDPAAAGLDCLAAGLPAPTCSATGGAGCPASLTPTGLQSGVAIPTLPNGGVVTIGLTCRVTANGLP
ncbi:prealbumin-like fold domain-containing protein [Pseudoxanthomonas japonensis]|uniref:prealbumin-like fold domain-containing protein n=1 Tax=Pseudoxanthomonas japonensis TaxID=69284 RepID=UPI001BCE5D1E|nr:DUF11 domain-containing protein [Pseudoxanthomonas japonensis]